MEKHKISTEEPHCLGSTGAPCSLKLCPFCGHKAVVTSHGNVGYPNIMVKCSNCNVETPVFQGEELATDCWNTRFPRWVKVSTTTLPPIYQDILFMTKKGCVYHGFLDDEYGYKWNTSEDVILDKVTHWMMVPELVTE